ncbi:hypothetical protein NHX12_004759 [Muraenolepis orangiensis]|uniref:IRG-type G domain-containing protein n=1 Tax=Muraenolepis orangiensis TaxID=630683 RepID=A0A9Q0DXD5_9TELE|nr:hypothetical protein NHX12_004759 [Muraenolepis orangiensis]
MSLESKVTEEIQTALENNDTHAAASIIGMYSKNLDSIPLNIAVTGESGSGKSTFVNAFRGIDHEDERAAPTGVVETTMKPYPHPTYPNVTLWDLPGIGTTKFPHVFEFEKFDFFIIVSADRFRENDAKVAQEIMKMGKTFYFVRAKIDNNLHDAEQSQKAFNREQTLQKIKNNCVQGLEEQGVTAPQVFLVSNFDLQLYDFPTLQETMERELPSRRRDVLNSCSNISQSIIKKKKEVFRSQIKYYSLTSAAVAAVPIPWLSVSADLGLLVYVLTNFLFGFGLDKKSLEKISSDTNKPFGDLRAVIKCFSSGKVVTKKLVAMLGAYGFCKVALFVAAEESSRWIPFLGIPMAASVSFFSIYRILSYSLDRLAVDAENVMRKALNIQ